MLRASKSSRLVKQIGGRGVRLSPETGKTNCIFLDYGGNLDRFGPIDLIQAPSIKKKNSDQKILV